MLPIVAIVGKPNVGKSSLFNRLVGRRRAIESSVSGTTRDQVSDRAFFVDHEVIVVDTGGLELEGTTGTIEADVQAQARAAIAGADVIVFVLDVRYDPTSTDFNAAELLRKSGKPCVMVANKCDHLSNLEDRVYNFFELGFGEPVAISAIHCTGVDELKDRVAMELTTLEFPLRSSVKAVPPSDAIRLTFVGRPNVGKSSLVNSIFGKEKVIVSEVPGTTRDAVEVPFTYEDLPFVLVDTAGIRRRGRVDPGIEKFSVLRSFQAIDDADVIVLVMDANDGVRSQDLHVCEFALREHKGLILVMNKMDTFEDVEKARDHLAYRLRRRMPFVPWAPVVFSSAKDRKNLFPILEVAHQIGLERRKRLDQAEMDRWLEDVVHKHTAAGGGGAQRSKVLGVIQQGVNPPVFVFKTQYPEKLHFSYQRYIENALRERFGFEGTGLRIVFNRSGVLEGRRHSG